LFVAPAIFTPFNCHWYKGETPPLIAVAVKVTEVPGHIVVEVAVMLTEATGMVPTVIVIWLEVAGEPVTQPALEVITQVILSLLARVVLLKVELVSPGITTPFFFH